MPEYWAKDLIAGRETKTRPEEQIRAESLANDRKVGEKPANGRPKNEKRELRAGSGELRSESRALVQSMASEANNSSRSAHKNGAVGQIPKRRRKKAAKRRPKNERRAPRTEH